MSISMSSNPLLPFYSQIVFIIVTLLTLWFVRIIFLNGLLLPMTENVVKIWIKFWFHVMVQWLPCSYFEIAVTEIKDFSKSILFHGNSLPLKLHTAFSDKGMIIVIRMVWFFKLNFNQIVSNGMLQLIAILHSNLTLSSPMLVP